MLIDSLTVGFFYTNCYLVACKKTLEAIVIDPGIKEAEDKKIFEKLAKHDLKIKYIVNTHGHIDHISGNDILKQATDAEILIHENDALMLADPWENLSEMLDFHAVSPPADRLLHDGDAIKIGRLKLKVIHTPGHSSGSISLYREAEDAVFTGDTLFAGSIGRTDLPGSSFKEIMLSLKDKIMKMPDNTTVYPGHGAKTTIGKEKRTNPFLLA